MSYNFEVKKVVEEAKTKRIGEDDHLKPERDFIVGDSITSLLRKCNGHGKSTHGCDGWESVVFDAVKVMAFVEDPKRRLRFRHSALSQQCICCQVSTPILTAAPCIDCDNMEVVELRYPHYEKHLYNLRIGTFLPLIVPPTIYQAGLWSTWLTVLCSLKMFQALARDRLERLNASPSVTPWTYLRVIMAEYLGRVDRYCDYEFPMLHLLTDPSASPYFYDYSALRAILDLISTNAKPIYRSDPSSLHLLLFFEPLSIAFETLQAILVHGFQFLDIWLPHSACNSSDCQMPKLFNTLTAGQTLANGSKSNPVSQKLAFENLSSNVRELFSNQKRTEMKERRFEIGVDVVGMGTEEVGLVAWDVDEGVELEEGDVSGVLLEWKGTLIRNFGFFLDMATFLMALGHYLYIWRLHGMAFHLVDAVLFLNIRALLGAIINRIKSFHRLRIALGALNAALPDATDAELRAYDDECAICRESMAKAKRLNCNHLFHLACLRSWLDQGLTEMYTCPTCRKPLFPGRSENETSSNVGGISSDEQLVRNTNAGLDRQNSARNTMPAVLYPNHIPNSADNVPWRGAGLDSGWLHSWPNQGIDGAGPSSTTIRTVGLGRVQMMMRQLTSVGETYAQGAFEDASWSLWPINPSQASSSNPTVSVGERPSGGSGSLHRRTGSQSANDNMANILAMAETVREVLPHIPDDIIFQLLGWQENIVKSCYENKVFRHIDSCCHSFDNVCNSRIKRIVSREESKSVIYLQIKIVILIIEVTNLRKTKKTKETKGRGRPPKNQQLSPLRKASKQSVSQEICLYPAFQAKSNPLQIAKSSQRRSVPSGRTPIQPPCQAPFEFLIIQPKPAQSPWILASLLILNIPPGGGDQDELGQDKWTPLNLVNKDFNSLSDAEINDSTLLKGQEFIRLKTSLFLSSQIYQRLEKKK
uniref:Putative Zinc finger, C3HC4 type (RING finger) n=1 Tax=Arachis ipaensis TaxID=130454 RepID=N1NFY2_ARAIP|nr:putative Zinc finger, C3HC4 type (RING finger) [Arachis ipaensis]